jgi:hypothetical protein
MALAMSAAVEVIGWTGAVLATVAYGLVTTNRVSSAALAFHVLNLAAAAGLAVNAAYHGALPGVALNVIWGLIALRGLVLVRAKRRRGEEVPSPR